MYPTVDVSKNIVVFIETLQIQLWCLPQSSIKSDSAKDKSKDKKKKSVVELVQDAPIKRTLGSVHVPLQSLLKGSGKVDVLSDFGASEGQATEMLKKASSDADACVKDWV